MDSILNFKISKDALLIFLISIFWILSGIRPFVLGLYKENDNWKKFNRLEKINLVIKSFVHGPFFKI